MLRTLGFTMACAVVLHPSAFAQETSVSVLDHDMQTLSGQDVNLAAKYDGKVVLLINVASRCGFTRQYGPLQELHEMYADQGLAVVGVPCNQFGGQEPGTATEIAEFCEANYGVTFDLLAKVNVNAPDQAPLYADLLAAADPSGPIKWNFEKILVGRDGRVVGRYNSRVKPLSDQLTGAIEQALAE